MKKVVLLLALILPVIFMSSCSDDSGIVNEKQLLGTWIIDSEIGSYTRVEITFQKNDKFELLTITESETENGSSTAAERRKGKFSLKNDRISFDNMYYFQIISLENNILKGDLDLGNGTYSVIAKKQ